ncbi:hypothetical protein AVEN_60826-1 [Araneus ventricosus]|uniref:N-acetyltransferase ESCO zinc-finger domain-containing protein n=1 Tax=Araneus ventricosus TaxID=182803 RepID=A0A4Y2PXX7_ARAVE|nr:hypothetical protein AVEN_60826-1 [Araneus ventricosus]
MTIGKIFLPTQQSWRTFPLLNSLGAEFSFPARSDFSPDGIPNMTIRLAHFLRFDGFLRLAFQKSVKSKAKIKSLHILDHSKGSEQLIIDADQKEIGAKICKTCGMIYTIGQEEDEKLHAGYHQT